MYDLCVGLCGESSNTVQSSGFLQSAKSMGKVVLFPDLDNVWGE